MAAVDARVSRGSLSREYDVAENRTRPWGVFPERVFRERGSVVILAAPPGDALRTGPRFVASLPLGTAPTFMVATCSNNGQHRADSGAAADSNFVMPGQRFAPGSALRVLPCDPEPASPFSIDPPPRVA